MSTKKQETVVNTAQELQAAYSNLKSRRTTEDKCLKAAESATEARLNAQDVVKEKLNAHNKALKALR